jgi:hypothetical protein
MKIPWGELSDDQKKQLSRIKMAKEEAEKLLEPVKERMESGEAFQMKNTKVGKWPDLVFYWDGQKWCGETWTHGKDSQVGTFWGDVPWCKYQHSDHVKPFYDGLDEMAYGDPEKLYKYIVFLNRKGGGVAF